MSSERLRLPVHDATTFILVRTHYPENVGASARAIKTMGFFKFALVKPGRMAVPTHLMAHKMAVKSWDVLESAPLHETLAQAVSETDVVFATTSRRGVSGVLQPREAARRIVELAAIGKRVAFVFGNEKTGLSVEDLALCHESVRIPMAADQPSVNLAQATQVIAYELFVAALDARGRPGG